MARLRRLSEWSRPFTRLSTPEHYDPSVVVAPSTLLLLLIDPVRSLLAVLHSGVTMTIHSFQAEVISRGARMLRTALGPAIATWLEDPSVVEVMLNPDGRLWIDRLSTGLVETQERLAAAEGERIVRLVAHHVGAEVHPASPRLSLIHI